MVNKGQQILLGNLGGSRLLVEERGKTSQGKGGLRGNVLIWKDRKEGREIGKGGGGYARKPWATMDVLFAIGGKKGGKKG